MLKIFWFLAILHGLPPLKANATSKRSLNTEDLISVISEEKLPREIAPTGYILDIFPIPDDAYFKGRVTINLVWQEDSNKIILHADPDLVIYQSELQVVENESPSRTLRILRSEKDPERSWYTIYLRKSLSAGTQARLSMTFTGKLNTEEHKGLFLSTYEDSSMGETKHFVGSYLKPNFARKIFPCLDEPEYKAPFEVSIVRLDTMTSLSNMPIVRSEPLLNDPTWIRDYFQESYPMATHSLGILVSDFNSISIEEDPETEKNFDAPIQIWGSPDSLETGQNVTRTILKAVNDLGDALSLPYPLPKLDYVFVPGVESNNWGLIIQSDAMGPQLIHNVVTQWIGHLVTPGLWSGETLDEGLRLFVTSYIMLQDSDYQDKVNEQIQMVLYRMNEECKSSDVPTTVDEIKIALFLRMLGYTLGEPTIKQGLQRFISETKFKTYMEIDLWNSITEQAYLEGTLKEDISVTEIADSWILATSQPVLVVKRNYKDNSATFSQHAYGKRDDDEIDYKWVIPIVLVKEDKLDFTNTAPVTWLKEESVRLPKIGNRDRFVIVNPEEIGPFPVNYDERNWKLLSEFLQNNDDREKIPVTTRRKLLHDAFILAKAGELSYKTAFNMILFLENEDMVMVWERFFVLNKYISTYLSESPVLHEKYMKFLRQWLYSLHTRLNENKIEERNFWFQIYIKENLCEVGFKPCIEESTNDFHSWVESSGELMNMEFNACFVFRWGSDEDFELGLQHLVENESISYSVNDLVGCVADSWKIEKILNVTIFERVEDFSDSDIEDILSKLGVNAVGYKTLFMYLEENWDALTERFGDKEELWKTFIETAISNFKTQEGLDLVKNFYSEKQEELSWAESTIQNALKFIEKQVERTSVDYPVIEEWLTKYLESHEDNTEDNFFLYER